MDNIINFKDIIKKRFLEDFTITPGTLNVWHVIFTMAFAFAIALFIFYIYRKTFSGILYSHNFNISLIMISLVTSLIILPITSNLTLSLGMVGALSIVRFRTAVKEPLDIVFMFWAIAAGITTGAGFYSAAVVGSLIIGAVIIYMSSSTAKTAMPYLLIVHSNTAALAEINELISRLPCHKLKSKIFTGEQLELTIEVRLRDEDSSFVNEIMKISGVRNVSLVSYQGDYVS